VYFVVEGLAEAIALGVNMYFFGEAWQIRLGTFAGATVRLFAGALFIAKSTAIVERVRGLAKGRPEAANMAHTRRIPTTVDKCIRRPS
jgi:hypothetical protein